VGRYHREWLSNSRAAKGRVVAPGRLLQVIAALQLNYHWTDLLTIVPSWFPPCQLLSVFVDSSRDLTHRPGVVRHLRRGLRSASMELPASI